VSSTDGGGTTPEDGDADDRPSRKPVTVAGLIVALTSGIVQDFVVELFAAGRAFSWRAAIFLGVVTTVAAIVGGLMHRYPAATADWVNGAARVIWSALEKPISKISYGLVAAWRLLRGSLVAPFEKSRFQDGLRLLATFLNSAAVVWLLVTLVGLMVPVLGIGRSAACQPQPTELRVVTSPESRDALREAGVEFAADQAAIHHCPVVHVSVIAPSSFTGVREGFGFTVGWQDPLRQNENTDVTSVLGPHPDIWIPASTAEVNDAESREPQGVEFDDYRSIATSPLVLAVPRDQARGVHDHLPSPARSATWPRLIRAARDAGLRVTRPDPGLSETGLLATVDLYRESHREDEEKSADRARRSLEGQIVSTGGALSNADDMFCAIRSGGDEHTAVVSPEHVLFKYNNGDPLGGNCPNRVESSARIPYVALHPGDVGSFDFPFVHVTWDRQADPAKDALIYAFWEWLDNGSLESKGYRDQDGNVGEDDRPNTERDTISVRPIDNAIDQSNAEYNNVRLAITAALVIDVSGSMNKPVVEKASRLDRAQELTRLALGQLGSADHVGLSVFPASSADDERPERLVGMGPAQGNHVEKVMKAVSGLPSAGRGHTPLYGAVQDAVERLEDRPDNPAAIVFTDGDDSVAGQSGIAQLANRLIGMSQKPRIVVIAIGEQECGEKDVVALLTLRRFTKVDCLPATSRATHEVIGELFARLGRG
jgi:hypothetical protein